MIRTLLVFLPLFIAGCYSNKPIASLDKAIFDESLLGRWSTIDDEGEFILTVSKLREKEYLAVPAEEPDAPMQFFITEIDGERFINAREIHDGKVDEDYMFGRLSTSDDNEVLIEVPELDAVPHEVTSSEELLQVFSENMDKPGFFSDKPKVYHRMAN